MSPCGVPPPEATTTSLTNPGSLSTRLGRTTAAITSTENMARYPAEKMRYPARPRSPALRCWCRYMPVIPASARAAITALAQLRATHWVVSVVKESNDGWPIWTTMKMAPATAAAAAAALVRAVAVTFMTGSWCRVPNGVFGDVLDARSRVGEYASHDDVTGFVISLAGVVLD